MNGINIRKILRELPLFSGTAPRHLGELARASRCVTFQKDQTIYRAGDAANKIYLLLSGQVKVALLGNRGNEKVIDVIEAGETFAEAELFGAHPYRASALAVKPSRVLSIGGEKLGHAMATDSDIALRIMRKLAKRQMEMEAELAANHYCSSSQRLLSYLLSLADPSHEHAEETVVTLTVSKQLLASRLDMQPESLSRILRNLFKSGLIKVERRRIRLNNFRIASYLENESFMQPIILPERPWPPRPGRLRPTGIVSRSGTEMRNGGSSSFGDSINKAGRQRMLSQRLAKSWLMLERGILSRRAQVILKQSVDLFDSQLKELEETAKSAEGGAASTELMVLWKPYRALLESKPSCKNASQLFSMNEAVLGTAQALTLTFEDADGTPHGKLINLAGRQRMLSQRMAKFFMFRRMGIEVRKCRSELEIANEEFSNALGVLASATQGQPRIAAELEQVAEHWRRLQSALTRTAEEDFGATACKVCTISERLLWRMDAAVELYMGLPA